MTHPVYKVVSFEIVGPHALRVEFDDGTAQVIEFGLILRGEIYGPLQDERLFRQVRSTRKFTRSSGLRVLISIRQFSTIGRNTPATCGNWLSDGLPSRARPREHAELKAVAGMPESHIDY